MAKLIKYLQLPFSFDVNRLQSEVNNLIDKKWLAHYQTLHYEGNWSAIPLRSVDGNHNDIIVSPKADSDYKNTIYLENSPYLQKVLSIFECHLQSVRLLKLDAGAVIKEHRDVQLNFENGEIRIHIPVITNDAVEFYLDKERINIKEGECWYFNFNLPHNIINNSTINRIHLVIDTKVNDWVKDIFSNAEKVFFEEELYNRDIILKMISHLRLQNTETSNRMADEFLKNLTPENI